MHHLIFEGPELAGKSWLMSQIYNHLEPKYNQNNFVLDGCHWFNCDVGIYGTKYSQAVIKRYLPIFSTLNETNIIVEKFHLSDIIYHQLHNQKQIDYNEIEDELSELKFKIVLITMPNNKEIIEKRLEERLNIYPHYHRIKKATQWYLEQQNLFLETVKKSKLPYLIVDTYRLPDQKPVDEILKWINEL